jgi:hypothetical protein
MLRADGFLVAPTYQLRRRVWPVHDVLVAMSDWLRVTSPRPSA